MSTMTILVPEKIIYLFFKHTNCELHKQTEIDDTNKGGEIMRLEISSFMTLNFFIWPFVYNIFVAGCSCLWLELFRSPTF